MAAALSFGSRAVLASPVGDVLLVSPGAGCADLLTQFGTSIDLGCNDSMSGGSGSLSFSSLVRVCQPTSRQHQVDCADLARTLGLLHLCNRSLQDFVYGDPERAYVEADIFRCTGKLLRDFVDKTYVPKPVSRQVSPLSKAELVGILVGLAVGVGLLAGWAVSRAVRRRANPAHSSAAARGRNEALEDAHEFNELPPPYPGDLDDHRLSGTYPAGPAPYMAHAVGSRNETPPPPYVARS